MNIASFSELPPGIYTISEIHTPPATPLLLTRDAGAGVTVRHPYSDHGPEQQVMHHSYNEVHIV
jgi:hypothetical protein